MAEVTVGSENSSSTVGQRRVQPILTGKMGVLSLTLTVMAFSAPMAVVEGFIPLAIMFGGPGACFGMLLTVAILLLFAMGYVTMAKSLPISGNFYAFISAGLGKGIGLGSAFLAILGYISFLCGSYIFLGVSAESLITGLGGPAIPWPILAVLGWLLVSTLGYFNIELSAKILGVAMVFEIAIVMIFNVFVLAKGGSEGLSSTPFTLSSFSNGDMGVTLLYSILIFMGFEATALFRGEVRNPDRTIPRATYMAVLLIGILYTLSCYGLVSAYGASAWEVAKNDPTDMFAHAIGRFVSPVFTQIAYCSVIMSLLAATLSIHNVLSRYVLNLAGDRVLPNYLARIHAKHSSPHAASNGIAIAAGIILAPLIYCGVDGSILYAVVTGVGGLCVILMLAIVSIAIINWFRLDGLYREYSIFKVFVAPAISACVFLSTFFFAVKHIDLVVGGAPGENDWVVWLIYGALVAGCSLATFFRVKKPGIYLGLGCASQLRH